MAIVDSCNASYNKMLRDFTITRHVTPCILHFATCFVTKFRDKFHSVTAP